MLVGGRSLCRKFPRTKLLTFMKSAVSASSKPKIVVKPDVSLIDEKIEVDVIGLGPNQQLTLQAKLKGDRNEAFESFAHYRADEHGAVRVSSQPSLGGSYTGIEPMGLMWSLKPSPGQKRGLRLHKRDVTKPYVVSLDAFDGHLRFGGQGETHETVGEPLASETFEKWYMKDDVRRIQVREGRIRGTLFLPPGDGPFPGVMEFPGIIVGHFEFKAALLASHGFAVLSLAYFGFEDLPKTFDKVEVEYFEEASRMFLQHPHVSSHGIGLLSMSKGSEIALTLAAQQSDIIKAVVAVSTTHARLFSSFLHKGKPVEYEILDHSKIKKTENGVLLVNECFSVDVNSPAIIPVERINCPICLVYGSNDLFVDAAYEAELIRQRMEDHGKGSLCTVLGYPNAGHVIEPPYTPLCHTCHCPSFGAPVAWGGEVEAHAVAQEDIWIQSLKFLRKYVSCH